MPFTRLSLMAWTWPPWRRRPAPASAPHASPASSASPLATTAATWDRITCICARCWVTKSKGNHMEPANYSIQFRLQRVTKEYAYVLVPVTEDILDFDGQGGGRINVNKITQRSIDLGQSPEVVWYLEDKQIQPH